MGIKILKIIFEILWRPIATGVVIGCVSWGIVYGWFKFKKTEKKIERAERHEINKNGYN